MHKPIAYSRVRFEDDFWQPRLERNRFVTLPYVYARLKASGRVDALRLDWRQGDPNRPGRLWESEVAMWMEAAAYVLRLDPDPRLEAWLEELVHWAVRAQHQDGYSNVYYTVVEAGRRWSDLREGYELYTGGHWIEAGVAHHETTGTTMLLDMGRRFADYAALLFGPQARQPRSDCGHPELELALVRLHAATGDRSYLDFARHLVLNRRGEQGHPAGSRRGEAGDETARALEFCRPPDSDCIAPEGHAVRAMRWFCGAADVALSWRDAELQRRLEQIWNEVTRKHLFLTGGLGLLTAAGAFGDAYDLASHDARAETCAAIGLLQFSHRLLLATCDSRYADEMERVLYNAVAGAVALDGRSFFDSNPLVCGPGSNAAGSARSASLRSEWCDPACCVTNVARLIASVGRFFFSETHDELAIHLYARCEFICNVGGQEVRVNLETGYPWKGDVNLRFDLFESSEFCLKLRLPYWCPEAEVFVNGDATSAELERGYVPIRRLWKTGDVVQMRMAMGVERVYALGRVLANAGRFAFQRGPLVYCLEGVDLEMPLEAISIPRGRPVMAVYQRHLCGGTIALQGEGLVAQNGDRSAHLYRFFPDAPRPAPFTAIPYCLRANRGPTSMQVWLRETVDPGLSA